MKKFVNAFFYGCGIIAIAFTIAFWVAFFFILGTCLYKYPLHVALVCLGLAVVIFLVGLIAERHSKTLHKG